MRERAGRDIVKLVIPRVTQEFFPVVSGPANQALALSAGLERLGIASPVLTTTPGSDPRVEAAGVRVERFRPVLAAPNFRPSLALQRHLLHTPASALHIHGWRNPASDSAIVAARRRGIPIVLQAHGIAYGYRYSRESPLIAAPRGLYDAAIRRYVTRVADIAVAGTAAESAELRAYGFPAERIVVIPIGVDPAFFAQRPQLPAQDDLCLLTVGRLGPRRNVEQLIGALAVLRAWGVMARLRVVGPEVRLAAGEPDGYRVCLRQLAERLGVEDLVTFTGPRHGAALLQEYHAADIFVCATLYENFGQPIAEAAATGLPIVVTPTGVALDLPRDLADEALVPFHDPVAMAVAIGRLHADRERRLRRGEAIRRYAAAAFDWRTIVPRYVDLYEEVAQRAARRAQPYQKVRSW
ncbi:MAG TPA: glycosyltransferase family 4 protein [Roseiflexaceae bacterium]|nr:glycosyltransferase family 4 protein [Roseiflexaceae bacterium]